MYLNNKQTTLHTSDARTPPSPNRPFVCAVSAVVRELRASVFRFAATQQRYNDILCQLDAHTNIFAPSKFPTIRTDRGSNQKKKACRRRQCTTHCCFCSAWYQIFIMCRFSVWMLRVCVSLSSRCVVARVRRREAAGPAIQVHVLCCRPERVYDVANFVRFVRSAARNQDKRAREKYEPRRFGVT